MAIQQSTDSGLRELALFAGAGGGILGGKLCGWETVCAVEVNAYRAAILAQRQNEKEIEPFPVWDNIQTFDGRPWRGIVDMVSGGFPCQDISAAGTGDGIEGKRSSLWFQMARIVCEVRPTFVFVENSPMLTSRGLGRVLGDLAEMGYDAQWGVLGARDAIRLTRNPVAEHIRERIWIVAYAEQTGLEGLRSEARQQKESELRNCRTLGHTDKVRKLQSEGNNEKQRRRFSDTSTMVADNCEIRHRSSEAQILAGRAGLERCCWWATEPNVGRVAHGVASRVDRIEAVGDGQVPAVVKLAWHVLCQRAAAGH